MIERPSTEDSDSPVMLNVKPRPFPLLSSQLEIIDGTPDLGVTSYWTDAEGNVVFSPNTPEEKMRTPVTKTQKRKGEKRGELSRRCLRFGYIFVVVVACLKYETLCALQSLWVEHPLCTRPKREETRKGTRRNQELWRRRSKKAGRRKRLSRSFLPTNQNPQRSRTTLSRQHSGVHSRSSESRKTCTVHLRLT